MLQAQDGLQQPLKPQTKPPVRHGAKPSEIQIPEVTNTHQQVDFWVV